MTTNLMLRLMTTQGLTISNLREGPSANHQLENQGG